MTNLSDSDIENLGIEDGAFDRDNHMPYQGNYGSSIDLNELTEKQREAYEQGYSTGAEDYDIYDEENDF